MGSTHETPGRFAPGESGIVGVFGMDLEGLEVVSGCSKRFIWKLTDISMNSCVDLLSPPAWWCGLKSRMLDSGRLFLSHHLRGGVDWNHLLRQKIYTMFCHHLRGGVDWNSCIQEYGFIVLCHHLRGGVDWNIRDLFSYYPVYRSPPAWWCGLKSVYLISFQIIIVSPPAWWCGLKYVFFQMES